MSEIRRDKKGRKLKDGESQRKDGRYQFRYTDISGERRYLYDWDLDKLRAKEKDISFQLSQGVTYFGGSVPFSDMVQKLFTLKPKWKESTRATMMRYLGIVKKSPLYNMQTNKIKMIDCKTYVAVSYTHSPSPRD